VGFPPPCFQKSGRKPDFLPTALVKKTVTGYNAYYEYTDALCAVVNKPMEEPGRFSASALERMIE
jgi:hypothetical protein